MSLDGKHDDEIDIYEIFAAAFYNWWIVCLSTFFFVFCAYYYSTNVAVPQFKATSRFELLDQEGGQSIFGQSSALAALAGPGSQGVSGEANLIEDRVLSRPFVSSIFHEAGFANDPIFNETLSAPSGLSKVLTLVFGAGEPRDLGYNDHLVMAIAALKRRMTIVPHENGIIELSLLHPDPKRAAEIVNQVVERVLLDIFERERAEVRSSLSYYADELLEVRTDLDAANAELRDFAISNDLQSAGELTRTSSRLAQIRRDIELTEDSIIALKDIDRAKFIGTNFANRHPVATTLPFRRLLELGRDPSDWIRPAEKEIEQAIDRLEKEKATLTTSLTALQDSARKSGSEALRLSSLEREVKVLETVYQSVVTQFEAQSLFSNFERDSGRIVESAISPRDPDSPKLLYILAGGFFTGLSVGFLISLAKAYFRGTLYTAGAFVRSAPDFELRSTTLKNFGKLNKGSLSAKQKQTSLDLLLSLSSDEKVVTLTGTSSETALQKIALSLSKSVSNTGQKSAVLDLSYSRSLTDLCTSCGGSESGVPKKFKFSDKIDVFTPTDGNFLRDHASYVCHLAQIKKKYTRLFVICLATNENSSLTKMAMENSDRCIVVCERARSKKARFTYVVSNISRLKLAESILLII